MEIVGFLILVAVIAYYVVGKKSSSTAREPQGTHKSNESTSPRTESHDLAFLRSQWAVAEKERADGATSTFPSWFFDPATDRQLRRLAEGGARIEGRLTKGAASDLIGLGEPVDEDQTEVLKFFKVSTRGQNQTLARYECKRLLADPANKAAWDARPASAMQKEFLKFCGIPAPKGITMLDAQAAAIAFKARAVKDASVDAKLDEWRCFEVVVEELWDAEVREEYEIKKPSLAAIRTAFDALVASGKTIEELSTEIDLVVEKLIELKPDLARSDA